MRKFEIIEHTADIGIRAFGKDMAELFSNAATGMFSLITDLKKVKEEEKYKVTVQGRNREDLMVNWLSELLYRFDVDKIIPSRYNILQISDSNLKAEVNGEKYDDNRHTIEREVKAATYYQLKVEKKSCWEAQIIFDI